MATINLSLPDQMIRWVEEQASGSRYGDASDDVRALIRRDQEQQNGISVARPSLMKPPKVLWA